MTMPPFTVGVIIAVLVVVLSILGVLGVLPARETVIFGLIGATAVSRLC